MFGAAAILRPAGNASVKLTTCAPLLAGGLVTVNVKVEVPPSAMLFGLNALFKLGLALTTMQLCVIASRMFVRLLMLLMPVVLTIPALVNSGGKLLQAALYWPVWFVTSTETVQVAATPVLAPT